MGSRFATRWLEAGYDLVGFDSDPAAVARAVSAGAGQAGSVAEVADRAETVFVSLPTPEAVYDVACRRSDCLATGTAIRTYVDLSTTGPSMAATVATALSARDIRCVDAPVSGGPAGAEAGSLTVIASGADDAIAPVRPLLEAIGSRIFVAGGEPGQAQLVKLINNLLSATAIAITGEALVLAAKAGLDPRMVLDVVNVSSGANNAAADKFPRQVLTRAFNHGFRLDLMTKDVRLCLAEAREREVPMVVGEAVEGLWTLATERLEPGADCTAIVTLFEAWGGASVTTPAQDDGGDGDGHATVQPRTERH
jgi:3-hydroxyisobutyrate dehydrogenase-like beta-hydroxyacid dehydrogenase